MWLFRAIFWHAEPTTNKNIFQVPVNSWFLHLFWIRHLFTLENLKLCSMSNYLHLYYFFVKFVLFNWLQIFLYWISKMLIPIFLSSMFTILFTDSYWLWWIKGTMCHKDSNFAKYPQLLSISHTLSCPHSCKDLISTPYSLFF